METLASDLNELITGLSLSDVTLLGWSMGAAVAMNYVRMYGCDTLKQLVLCDMTPKQLNDDEWKLGLYQGAYTKADAEKAAGQNLLNGMKRMRKSRIRQCSSRTAHTCSSQTILRSLPRK